MKSEEIGHQIERPLGFAAADFLVEDPGHAADQGLLDRVGKAGVGGRVDPQAARRIAASRRRIGRRRPVSPISPRPGTCARSPDSRRRRRERRGGRRLDAVDPLVADVDAGLLDPAPRPRHGAVEGAEEDLFLAVEVVVQRFAGYPGTPNDVGDLGRLIALFRGQLRHRIHDAATLTHCYELSWKHGPSRLHLGSPAWGWEHGVNNTRGARKCAHGTNSSGTLRKLGMFLLETSGFPVPIDRVQLSEEKLVAAIGDHWPPAEIDAAVAAARQQRRQVPLRGPQAALRPGQRRSARAPAGGDAAGRIGARATAKSTSRT